jgi:succinate dehydrogenase / fumarate reductase, membrane anchor subunit
MTVTTIKTRPERSSPRRDRLRPRSAREWRVTTLTGVALLLLLTVHMIANHFVIDSVGGLRNYDEVLDYIANPVIFTIESFFLLFVTVHAMLGVRGVLYDLDPGPRQRRWIDVGLVTLGLATLGYGYFLLGTLASRA